MRRARFGCMLTVVLIVGRLWVGCVRPAPLAWGNAVLAHDHGTTEQIYSECGGVRKSLSSSEVAQRERDEAWFRGRMAAARSRYLLERFWLVGKGLEAWLDETPGHTGGRATGRTGDAVEDAGGASGAS